MRRKERKMDGLTPLLAVIGLGVLWIFVLSRLKGG
jgi:hypothetical protein